MHEAGRGQGIVESGAAAVAVVHSSNGGGFRVFRGEMVSHAVCRRTKAVEPRQVQAHR